MTAVGRGEAGRAGDGVRSDLHVAVELTDGGDAVQRELRAATGHVGERVAIAGLHRAIARVQPLDAIGGDLDVVHVDAGGGVWVGITGETTATGPTAKKRPFPPAWPRLCSVYGR